MEKLPAAAAAQPGENSIYTMDATNMDERFTNMKQQSCWWVREVLEVKTAQDVPGALLNYRIWTIK